MAIQFRSPSFLAQLVLGFTVIGGCLSLTAGLAAAQSTDPLDTHNEQTSDPFTADPSDNNSTFFDIMHRVQLGNIRSVSEFSRDQQGSIGSEASGFRERQRALLQGEQPEQPQPVTPAPAAEPTPAVNP